MENPNLNAKKEGKKGKILVCGAGSIGIFLGAKLNSGEYEVYLFGRRKLKNAGNKISINSKKYTLPKSLFKLPKNQRYDFVFITSKLYDFDKIIELINKNHVKSKIFSCIQNGIIDLSKYKKSLHNQKLIPICVFGGFRIEKNKLISNPTPTGWVTEYSEKGRKISTLLSNCGVQCKAAKNFNLLRAEKMIVNCCLNALSAIEKKPFNELFSGKKTRERINKIFDECYAVLKKKYPLEKKEKLRKRLYLDWHKVNHYSSTYQDIVSGRKSEVPFFNSAIVKLGKQKDINTQENKRILEDLKK